MAQEASEERLFCTRRPTTGQLIPIKIGASILGRSLVSQISDETPVKPPPLLAPLRPIRLIVGEFDDREFRFDSMSRTDKNLHLDPLGPPLSRFVTPGRGEADAQLFMLVRPALRAETSDTYTRTEILAEIHLFVPPGEPLLLMGEEASLRATLFPPFLHPSERGVFAKAFGNEIRATPAIVSRLATMNLFPRVIARSRLGMEVTTSV